jgi:hypothetical protein
MHPSFETDVLIIGGKARKFRRRLKLRQVIETQIRPIRVDRSAEVPVAVARDVQSVFSTRFLATVMVL